MILHVRKLGVAHTQRRDKGWWWDYRVHPMYMSLCAAGIPEHLPFDGQGVCHSKTAPSLLEKA